MNFMSVYSTIYFHNMMTDGPYSKNILLTTVTKEYHGNQSIIREDYLICNSTGS